MELQLASYDKGPICQVRWCRTPKPINRWRGVTRLESVCSRCKSRRWRANNPDKELFRDIRSSASRRKLTFCITLDYLRALPRFAEYIRLRGIKSNSLHLDRHDPRLGYVVGNLRIITAGENIAKGNRERHTNLPPVKDDPF